MDIGEQMGRATGRVQNAVAADYRSQKIRDTASDVEETVWY